MSEFRANLINASSLPGIELAKGDI